MKTDLQKLEMQMKRIYDIVKKKTGSVLTKYDGMDSVDIIQDIKNEAIKNNDNPDAELYFVGRQMGALDFARRILTEFGNKWEDYGK